MRTNCTEPETTRSFASIEDELLRRLGGSSKRCELPADAELFRQGERPATLDILVQGMVKLCATSADGSSAVVEIVAPIEPLVFASVWLDAPYLVTARALQRVTILRVPAEALRHMLEAEPSLLGAAAQRLCSQYRSAVGQITDLKLRSVAQRLGGYLVKLHAEHVGRREFRLPYGKQLLAARLGTSPEHLSRAFGTLRLYGVVTRGSRVQIVDIERLKSFAAVDGELTRAIPPPPSEPSDAAGQACNFRA